MALSKSGSRPITVGNKQYRWSFFGNDGGNDVTVQCASGAGQKLRAKVEYGSLNTEGQYQELIVTSGFVEQAIKFALAAGWKPSRNGPPFRISYEGGTFGDWPTHVDH